MGVFFAALGFTYALATSGSGDATLLYNSSSRAIGTTCPRPATQFVTSSDLGFVLVSSNYRRQILVRFGVGPHTFILNKDPNAISAPPVSVTSGGAVTGTPSTPGRFDFSVTVQDASSEKPIPQITKGFFLTAVPQTAFPVPLSFINGSVLPTAVTGTAYGFSLQANGGNPSYTFALADDASNDAIPIGLTLTPDGLIFGTPVVAATNPTPFRVVVTDFIGNSVTQAFTLPVVQGSISTDVIASSGNFKFSFGRDGSHDSLNLTLILNKDDLATNRIRTKADLAGVPVVLRFGGVAFPPGAGTNTSTSTDTSTALLNTFDGKGVIVFPLPVIQGGTLPRPKNQPSYRIALNPKTGIMNVRFNGISLINGLRGNFRNFRNIIPVEVSLGSASGGSTSTDTSTSTSTDTSTFYDKSSLVQFDYRRTSTTGSGRTNKRDISSPGGQFLITKVIGSEVKGSGDFDVIKMKLTGFLRLPFGAPLNPVASDVVSVVVGSTKNSCIGSFPASSLARNGDVLTFTNNDATVPLHTLEINNKKGTILIDMNSVEAFRIFNEDSLVSGDPHLLPVLLTFSSPDGSQVTLDFISSVVVYRSGLKLQNR